MYETPVIQTVNLAAMFIGLGFMAVLFVFSYMLYQWSRIAAIDADKEDKYGFFEILAIEEVAKARGIDMQKIALERELIRKKSFRNKLNEEMIKKMFPEKEDKKEK